MPNFTNVSLGEIHRGGGADHVADQRVRGKDGKYRWFLNRYKPLKGAEGRLVRWYAAATDIPFAFSVGDKQLPAGAYAVHEMDRATLIQSRDGENSVLGTYAYAGPSKAAETKLVFNKVGDHYFLAQIWTSARGQGLVVPQSKLEKEMRASNNGPKGGVETVIVALR